MTPAVAPSRLAAIVYKPQDDIDALLAGFAARIQQRGVAVAGLVQITEGDDACTAGDMSLRDVATGRVVSICQDLGPNANACRLDPQGLAQAAGLLREALGRRPDLVVLNKFGKSEIEGGGLADEVGFCVAADIPLAIGVPVRFLPAWELFADGMDVKLPAESEALDAWWNAIASLPEGA